LILRQAAPNEFAADIIRGPIPRAGIGLSLQLVATHYEKADAAAVVQGVVLFLTGGDVAGLMFELVRSS